MNMTLDEHLTSAREAIIAGDPLGALEHIEAFGKAAEDSSPSDEDKEHLKALVEELAEFAAAALAGTEKAVARIEAIIRSASNLQVYNESGERVETSIVAKVPQRF